MPWLISDKTNYIKKYKGYFNNLYIKKKKTDSARRDLYYIQSLNYFCKSK